MRESNILSLRIKSVSNNGLLALDRVMCSCQILNNMSLSLPVVWTVSTHAVCALWALKLQGKYRNAAIFIAKRSLAMHIISLLIIIAYSHYAEYKKPYSMGGSCCGNAEITRTGIYVLQSMFFTALFWSYYATASLILKIKTVYKVGVVITSFPLVIMFTLWLLRIILSPRGEVILPNNGL